VTAGDQTTRFTYDRLNRLAEIVVPEGRRLHYSYRDGEPDLRLQMDHHTGRAFSERITSGLTFSSALELIKNRTEASTFGVVRFDRAMVDYRLASEFGVALPDAVAASAVARIRVMGLGEAGNKKKTFDAPSNVLFIPAEYWAVNCCLPCGGGSCFDCIEPIALDCCDPAGGGGAPQGACCLDVTDGRCVETTFDDCTNRSGLWQGNGTHCGAAGGWPCCMNEGTVDDIVICTGGGPGCYKPRLVRDTGVWNYYYGTAYCNGADGTHCAVQSLYVVIPCRTQ